VSEALVEEDDEVARIDRQLHELNEQRYVKQLAHMSHNTGHALLGHTTLKLMKSFVGGEELHCLSSEVCTLFKKNSS